MSTMATKIFVSGFYDIIHAGHIQFFREARSLGDCLIVSFASGQVLWKSKRRKPSIPDDHKKVILESLCTVSYTHLDVYKRQVESIFRRRSSNPFPSIRLP